MLGIRYDLRSLTAGILAVLFSVLPTSRVAAQVLEDSDTFEVKGQWSASSLGIPGPLGALLFHPDEGVLYVVGASESADSALYAVTVTRGPQTDEVLDLGPPDETFRVFSGNANGLDSGCEFGPQGTLFNTYFDANLLGQRSGDVEGPERLFDMFLVGIPSSVTGLTFSPYIVDPDTDFGMLQVSSWGQGPQNIYNVPLIPLQEDYFEPQEVQSFLTLPTASGAGGIHYIPSGPHEGNLMYVDWNAGTVSIALIDKATGFPIDSQTDLPDLGTQFPSVELFAGGMGAGPWGLDFDPLTHDLFVSTWEGSPSDSIIRIGGFPPPAAARRFLRGDCNDDGRLDVADPIANLTYQFLGETRPCLDACDFDDSGEIDVTDPIANLTHQFLGGLAPAPPGKDTCGVDPTEDELDCESFEKCPAGG